MHSIDFSHGGGNAPRFINPYNQQRQPNPYPIAPNYLNFGGGGGGMGGQLGPMYPMYGGPRGRGALKRRRMMRMRMQQQQQHQQQGKAHVMEPPEEKAFKQVRICPLFCS